MTHGSSSSNGVFKPLTNWTFNRAPRVRGHPSLSVLFFVSLILAVIATTICAQIKLPDIGDSSRSALSPSDEIAMGDTFLREITAHLPLSEDVEVVSYIRRLGSRLVEAGESGDRSFRFFVIDLPAVNAFAGPGGIIGINTGLIGLTRSESELASVIAHEIAHVTQNHLARAVEASERVGPLAIAGIIAGLVLAAQNAEAGRAAVTGVVAGSAQNRLDFTRENEKEADRIGTALLADAGYDPRAMPSFFEHMQESNRFYSEPPEFLSTHPVTVNRIAESRARSEQYPYKQFENSVDYRFVRAKVSARLKPTADQAVEDFQAQFNNGLYESEDSIRYALAVALISAKRWVDALPHVEWLLKRHPNRTTLMATWADIMRHTNQPEKARFIYKETLHLYPTDTLINERYAEFLLSGKQPTAAFELLEAYAKHRPPTAKIHALIARALNDMGRSFEANSALAEAHVSRGNIDAAINQLMIALRRDNGDQYATAKAQARLERLKLMQSQRTKSR